MRKPDPSDLTDEPWEIVRPLIPVSRVGRPREVDLREVLNAIFYLDRAGGPWDMLPHDFPPKSTVSDYFAQCRDDGTWQEIRDALRQKVRVAAGKEPSPSAGSIDTGIPQVTVCKPKWQMGLQGGASAPDDRGIATSHRADHHGGADVLPSIVPRAPTDHHR